MIDLTVTSDFTPIALVTFNELPEEARSDFDYVDPEGHDYKRFALFKGCWYDTSDVQSIRVREGQDMPMGWAMYVGPDHPFAKWDAIVSESFFSGALIRYIMDDGSCDAVVMGRYYS